MTTKPPWTTPSRTVAAGKSIKAFWMESPPPSSTAKSLCARMRKRPIPNKATRTSFFPKKPSSIPNRRWRFTLTTSSVRTAPPSGRSIRKRSSICVPAESAGRKRATCSLTPLPTTSWSGSSMNRCASGSGKVYLLVWRGASGPRRHDGHHARSDPSTRPRIIQSRLRCEADSGGFPDSETEGARQAARLSRQRRHQPEAGQSDRCDSSLLHCTTAPTCIAAFTC